MVDENTTNKNNNDTVYQLSLRLKEEFLEKLKLIGFHAFGYHKMGFTKISETEETPYVSHSVDFVRHYIRQGYSAIDPMLLYSMKSKEHIIIWSEIKKKIELTDKQKQLLEDCNEQGLDDCVRIIIDPYSIEFITIFSDKDNLRDHFEEHRAEFERAFHKYKHGLMSLRAPLEENSAYNLTEREKLCLLWAARGKSNWVIATLVGITENSVKDCIKSCIKKLEASSRTDAAIIATRNKIIFP